MEPIREHDHSGRLTAAGVEWIEHSQKKIWFTAILTCPLVLVWPMLLVGMFVSGFRLDIVGWFVGISLAVIVLWRVLSLWACRRHSVIFYTDGRLSAPHGYYSYHGLVKLPPTHDTILSIECRRYRGDEYCIEMMSSEGDAHRVGQELVEIFARKATVQLTKALKEVREARARIRQRQPTSGYPPTPPRPAYIN